MIPQFIFKTGELFSVMENLPNQIKQGAATALNHTAEEALAVVRTKMLTDFHVRVPAFDLPPVQLPSVWRAKPNSLFVTIALGDDSMRQSIGGRRIQIFGKFGAAQRKATPNLAVPIAIPTTELRPNIGDLVPRAMYPKNLRLVQRMLPDATMLQPKARGTKRSQIVKVGALKLKQQDRTFVMPNSFGKKSWGVWERVGSGKRDIRMDWIYKDDIAIPKKMSFEDDVTRVINERLEINFTGAVILASAGVLWGKAKRA